jgi:hypothetical protein
MIGDIELAAGVLAVGMIVAALIVGVALIVAAGRIKKGLEK